MDPRRHGGRVGRSCWSSCRRVRQAHRRAACAAGGRTCGRRSRALRALEQARRCSLFGSIGTELLFAIALGLFARGVRVRGPARGAACDQHQRLVCSRALSPCPAGSASPSSASPLGLTSAGMAPETAVATVLLYRIATFYLPPAWGFPRHAVAQAHTATSDDPVPREFPAARPSQVVTDRDVRYHLAVVITVLAVRLSVPTPNARKVRSADRDLTPTPGASSSADSSFPPQFLRCSSQPLRQPGPATAQQRRSSGTLLPTGSPPRSASIPTKARGTQRPGTGTRVVCSSAARPGSRSADRRSGFIGHRWSLSGSSSTERGSSGRPRVERGVRGERSRAADSTDDAIGAASYADRRPRLSWFPPPAEAPAGRDASA